MKLWNVFIISTLQFIEVYGEVGDSCSGNDVINCTSSSDTTGYTCINSTCQCSDGFYQDSSNSCQQKSGYNDSCQTGTCIEENTDCYSTTGNTGSCKCKQNYYRNTVNNMCKPVSDLVPTNVNISDVTRTSFTINWTSILRQFVSSYIITGEPGISKHVDNNIQSTSINNNIQPGTRYNNILVTAVITTDRGTVNVSSTPGLSILTRSDYNENCFTSEDKCNVINGGCYDVTNTCKCNNDFYTHNNNQCKPVSDLKPTDFNSTTSTTTNITFTWTVSSSDKIKHFIITGTNLPSQPDISNTMTTTTITGLTPGTTYTNIIITAVVSTDRGDVNVSSNVINEVTTESGYNDSCQTGTCIEENTDCYSTTGNTGSCKCKQNYYRNTVNNMCKYVSDLVPTNVNISDVTRTSFTINWTSILRQFVSSYIITGEPGISKHVDNNIQSTSINNNIQPGTRYNNILVTAVITTDRGTVNVSSTPGLSILTRSDYNENCFTSEDKCNVINGGCYDVTNTCKCNNNFYTDNNNQCKPVSDLKPTDFISTTSTTTNITVTWTVSSSDKIKHFIITGTNLPSQPDISNTMTTTAITGLTPGTTYTNIIITAVVSTDRGDVNVSSNVINEVTTESGYNDSCQTGTCIEENTDCYSTTGNTGSCKCKQNYYRNTVNNMCKYVSDLVPTNVNISDVTRTSFTINWTSILRQFVSSYIITGEPGISKTVDNNTQSTSINNNIQPGTRYNNILVTAVITTDRGTVNVSSTPGLSILTRSDYNENCFTSEDKCNVINGGCYDVTNTCKCNNNFYTDNNNQCKPVSDLKPTDFISTTSTTTNITVTWTVSSSDKIKHFIITGTNLPSQPDISNTMTTTAITGLTPGTTYTNIIITAVVSTDRGDVNVSSNVISASTVPGKAGDLSTSNEYNTTKTMTIEFNAPDEGSVDYYIVNILNTNVYKTTSTNSIQLGPTTLLPGILYTITITTFYKNKQGETSTQTFRTISEGSSPVENLSITDIGSRKLTVSWSYPTDDKGNLTAYILDINDNGVCIQQYRFFYGVNNQVDLSSMRSCNNVYNISHDLRQRVHQDISNLLPDTTYTVSVIPYNGAGPGQIKEQTTKTLIEAPGEVTEFSISDVTATSVTFTWKKPTPRPGPTNYTLLIYEQSDLSDGNVSHLYHTKTLTDYNTEKYIAYNLTSFWYYRATIQAATESGSSSQVSLEKFQTQASAPGPVKNLIHEKMDNVFTSVRIKWNCPEERDRHGIIEGYILSYTNEMPVNFSSREDCSYSEEIIVTPGNKYIYTVVAYSDEFVGISRTGEYTAAIGKPIISQDSGTIIREKEQAVGMTSFTLDICASCLLDDTNGEIIFSALIICVKDVCSTDNFNQVDVANLMSYKTWQQSKKAGFDSPYRITNDTWHQHLKGEWQKVVIGGESNCDNKPEDVVCNGPLNTDTEYRVIAISCTQGGCSATGPQGSFRTLSAASNIVIPVVISLVLLVVLVIVAVLILFIYRRRKRNQPPPSVYENINMGQTRELGEIFIPRYRSVILSKLSDKIDELESNSNHLFTKEFQDIQKLSSTLPSLVASKKENKSKNRNEKVVPYDHCRVKLKDSTSHYENIKKNDYINASYIPGSPSNRNYIATQSPLESTVADFWRMVWEENVNSIVMLTSAEKFKYWNDDSPMKAGTFVIQVKTSSDDGRGKLRTIEISLPQETRTIKHLYMSRGMDFFVNPNQAMTFVQFVKRESNSSSNVPLLVHCSDGSERTCAFIVLDILQQQIKEKDMSSEIDIFDLVLKTLNYRKNVIKKQETYMFIYHVAEEMVEEKKRLHRYTYSTLYQIADAEHVYS